MEQEKNNKLKPKLAKKGNNEDRAETNEIKNRKTIEKNNQTMSFSLKKLTKLARL